MRQLVQVPREPTDEMYKAGLDHVIARGTAWCVNDVYKAMVEAWLEKGSVLEVSEKTTSHHPAYEKYWR